jgi:hypothetical protein
MKTPHVLCVVAALVAVCVLVGFVLRNMILSPETAADRSAEAHVPADEPATNDENVDEPESGWPGGGFGGGGFGGGFGTRTDRDYPERKPLMAWVEAMFLQVATDDLDDIRVGDQPAFARGNEKLLLSADEKGALFDQLRAKPSFRTIASASVTTISGQQALMQFVECLPYLTERDTESTLTETPEAEAKGELVQFFPPPKLEEIELGARVVVTPTISCDGEVITLVVLPEVSQITGWADFGSGPPQPLYRTYNITTTVYLRDGMSVLMPGVPLRQHGGAPHPNVKSPEEPPGGNTVLLLVTARIIELPDADEPETDSPPADSPTDADPSAAHDDTHSF